MFCFSFGTDTGLKPFKQPIPCIGFMSHPPINIAQERLGHKGITTTMNIYSHVVLSSAREAAEKIGQLVYFSDAV